MRPVTQPSCIPVIVQNNVINSDRSVVDIGKGLFDSGLCQVRMMAAGRSSRVAADSNISSDCQSLVSLSKLKKRALSFISMKVQRCNKT